MTRLIFATVFTVALCMISSASYAQSEINVAKNEFGLFLGFNGSMPRVDFEAGNSLPSPEVYTLSSGPGFDLGVLYQRMLSDKFHLRVQPNLAFTSSEVLLNGVGFIEGAGVREAVMIELPINIVFENVTRKIGPSFSMGAKYGYDLVANSRTRRPFPNLPLIKAHQLSLDFSAGIRCHFKKFNLKPELVYNRGLLEQSDLPIATDANFDNFNMDQLTFRLVFYGANWKKNS